MIAISIVTLIALITCGGLTLFSAQPPPSVAQTTSIPPTVVKVTPRPTAILIGEEPSLSPNFGNQFELVAHSTLPDRLTTDEEITFPLTLTWRAKQPIEQPYSVFVHILRKADETLFIQSDMPLSHDNQPWRTDDLIITEQRLIIDNLPVGRYTVLAGVYRTDTGERLAILDSNPKFPDAVELETFEAITATQPPFPLEPLTLQPQDLPHSTEWRYVGPMDKTVSEAQLNIRVANAEELLNHHIVSVFVPEANGSFTPLKNGAYHFVSATDALQAWADLQVERYTSLKEIPTLSIPLTTTSEANLFAKQSVSKEGDIFYWGAILHENVLVVLTANDISAILGQPNEASRQRFIGALEILQSRFEAAQTAKLTAHPSTRVTSFPFGYGLAADPRGNSGTNIGHLKTLGFDWVKFVMPWAEVETQVGQYEWAMWDHLINQYDGAGINILLTISDAPQWAQADKTVDGLPSDLTAYANFAAEVADRYAGQVKAIELWPWPNMSSKSSQKIGGTRKITPKQFVAMLQHAYPAIKAFQPTIMVIAGGLSPTDHLGETAMDDMAYLEAIYALGGKGYFDALGANPYGFNCPALADWRTVTPAEAQARASHGLFTNRHHSWCFLGTMEGYRQIMVANHDADTPIMITEFGWASVENPRQGYEYASDNTPTEQRQWTVEAYQWAAKQSWVGPMFLKNIDEEAIDPQLGASSPLGYLRQPFYNALVTLKKAP